MNHQSKSEIRNEFLTTLRALIAESPTYPDYDPNNPWTHMPIRLAEAAVAVLEKETGDWQDFTHIMTHFNMLKNVAYDIFDKHVVWREDGSGRVTD